MTRQRGGSPQAEREHASVLLSHGPGQTRGWESPAGRARVEQAFEGIARRFKAGLGQTPPAAGD